MPGKLTQKEFNDLIEMWTQDHVMAIQDIFGVVLTSQQQELVRLADNQTARVAVSSCTSSGKTAVLSMLVFLYLIILPDCRILITSPSFQQLSRVFATELAKWHRAMPKQLQDLFVLTREKVEYKGSSKYMQIANLVTASTESENIQGGHSKNYVILADEGSGIPEDAFDVLLGTLGSGEGGRFIIVSNPVRSSGSFYNIFARDLPGWNKLYFSAHESPNVSKAWIQEMADTYGTDSDLYRMRVEGRFPRIGAAQFISGDVVEEAIRNVIHPQSYSNFPKVVGCDIARFGGDSTVFTLRQGPKLLDFKNYKGLDTMEVSGKLAEYHALHQPAKIFIDSIGVGAGTYDRCKQLKLPVAEVIVSNKSTEPNVYCNLRSQLWGKMREWLQNGADIPTYSKDRETNLASQLTSLEYFYNAKMQIQLLAKKDLKKLGYESPDIADSLSLTFADAVYEGKSRHFTKRPIKTARFMWV